MTDNSKLIQGYINNFRRKLTRYLREGIGISCTIYPTEKEGAILQFSLGPDLKNDDDFRPISESIGQALGHIEQKAFGGNLEGFKFGGTNLIVEDTRIILIKDFSPKEWNDEAAAHDISQVLPKPPGGQK